MKKLPCNNSTCGDRRKHWCEPFTSRGVQYVEVADDYPENKKVYCSIECACYAGDFSVTKGWKLPDGTWEN